MGSLIYILGCNGSGTSLLRDSFENTTNTIVVGKEFPPAMLFYAQKLFGEDKNIVMQRCSTIPAWGASFGGADPYNLALGFVKMCFPDATKEEVDTKLASVNICSSWIEWLSKWKDVWYVYIRRDPRDIIINKINATTQSSNVVNSFVKTYKDSEDAYGILKSSLSDKVLMVKYEDLVLHQTATMGELFKQIGLMPTDKIIKPQNTLLKKNAAMSKAAIVDNWKSTPQNIEIIGKIAKENESFAALVVNSGYDVKDWQTKL